MSKKKTVLNGCMSGLGILGLLAASPAAHAGLRGTSIDVQTFHYQTGGATYVDLMSSPLAILSVGNAQIIFQAMVDAPSDFTSIRVSGPGFASPGQILDAPVLDNGTYRAEYHDVGFVSVATVNAKYPLGSTYTFIATASDPALNQTVTNTYAENHPPLTTAGGTIVIPLLTAGSYASLQNLDAASSILLGFNAPFYGDGTTFFDFGVFARSSLDTFESVFSVHLPNTTGSLLLPAETLTANTQYVYLLGYGNNTGSGHEFLNYTFGEFTTAVPEPQTISLLLLGLGVVCLKVTGRRPRL
jgi:hypothetical protein